MKKGDLGQSDINVEHLCWGVGNSDEGFRDNILGRVVGGSEDYSRDGDELEDGQEPLALLVVHAAMHMLFLPQFTCEFFEENNDADLDDESRDLSLTDSQSVGSRRKTTSKEEDITEEEKEAQRLRQIEEEEGDIFMRKEAGLKETRYAESGVMLLPRPTTIVWAGGIGLKPNKVRERKIEFSFTTLLQYMQYKCNSIKKMF